MEIYLIRHTSPDVEKGICYGQSDVQLKATFGVEAEKVLEKIPSDIDIIYTSPLSRCLRLADYLAARLAVPIATDTRLMELDFGEWEMKKWDDIDKVTLQIWMDDYVNVRCQSGESYLDLAKRVSLFLDQIRIRDYKKVVVVTHHGILKALYARLQQVSLIKAMDMHFPYGSITKIW